jgi:hypothetical protein
MTKLVDRFSVAINYYSSKSKTKVVDIMKSYLMVQGVKVVGGIDQ